MFFQRVTKQKNTFSMSYTFFMKLMEKWAITGLNACRKKVKKGPNFCHRCLKFSRTGWKILPRLGNYEKESRNPVGNEGKNGIQSSEFSAGESYTVLCTSNVHGRTVGTAQNNLAPVTDELEKNGNTCTSNSGHRRNWKRK
jgi:hypothetical protein